MPQYRRARLPGGSYFLTLTLADRCSRLLTDQIEHVRGALRTVRRSHPFAIDGIVVLPDHLHALISLPAEDADYPTRVRLIKMVFTKALPPAAKSGQVRASRGERKVWQQRYWEHQIRDQRDFNAHMDYIHFNPVKHGHVLRVCEWPYSSFHRWVQLGVYPQDWGGGGLEGEVGDPE